MQTLTEIRRTLEQAQIHPNRRLGQCFLVDLNLMRKVVEMAELTGDEVVLEVGPGTGSLTEELLQRARRVVAVELDRKLAEILRDRLGQRENLHLIPGDVLAGKHEIAPEVIAALQGPARLVSNLPYAIATPLIAQCLLDTRQRLDAPDAPGRFERLTFTVQLEVADRLTAGPGSKDYGPVSVLVALTGQVRIGPVLPPQAFWPAPKIDSRLLRIDFDPQRAARIADVATLQRVLSLVFTQRRKQIGSAARRKDGPFDADAFEQALREVGVDATLRPEQVGAEQFLQIANRLVG